MNLRRLLVNAGSASFQVVLSAVVLFLVYGYIVREIGVDLFGVWATVAASTSVAAIGGLGLAGGVVKFVAKYRALDDLRRVSMVLSTSMLAAAVALGFMAALGLFLLPGVLPWLMDKPDELEVGIELVPYVVVSFWLTSVSAIGVSGLDGFNRIDIRAAVYMGAMIVYAALVFVLLPKHGIIGLVEAQIVQGTVLLVVPWIVLGVLTRHRGLLPLRWSNDVFREVVGYGVSFQIIGIAQILFEPTTKALMTKFGGAGATGIFEMANRLAFQARSVIDASHRSIVPSLAELHELDAPALPAIYARSAKLLVLVAATLLPALVVFMPVVSVIWLGTLEISFVVVSVVLSTAWMLNLLATPAYYANLGTGALRWNVIGTVVTALMNITLSFWLGRWWGAGGVVTAFVVSLLAGNALMIWEYHRRHPGIVKAFAETGDVPLVAGSILITLAAALVGPAALDATRPVVYIFAAVVVLGAVLPPLAMRHSGFRLLRDLTRAVVRR